MLAYRLPQPQTQPDFQDVPEPHAGPGPLPLSERHFALPRLRHGGERDQHA